MVLALEIRKDRTPAVLRRLAKEADDARIARRILAIANALDGMSRDEAARAAGMDRQTLRDRVLRYNAHGVDGLAAAQQGGDLPQDGKRRCGAIGREVGEVLLHAKEGRSRDRCVHPRPRRRKVRRSTVPAASWAMVSVRAG